MKNAKLIILIFSFSHGYSQSPLGVYTDVSKAHKQIDSLLLNTDSTYRYAFYYPKYGVSEYYTGKWRYIDNNIFLDNSGMKHPAFILTPTTSNGIITQLQVTKAKLKKTKKGQVLIRNYHIEQKSIDKTDTLNKFTSDGKKTGYWKVLLDDKADPVDSLKDAYFYGIEMWDNGEDVFNYEKHKWTFSKMTFDGTLPEKGNPKLIEGTFKWFDNKGFLQISETYKNGQPLYIRSYHVLNNKTDTINHLFEDCDFTIKYNNIPGTYYYREHALATGTFSEYWFRKGKKGWRVYKIKT